jgi:hypothetical protein
VLCTSFNTVFVVEPFHLFTRDTQLVFRHPDDGLSFPECWVVECVSVNTSGISVLGARVGRIVVSCEYLVVDLTIPAIGCRGLVELGSRLRSADQGRVGVDDEFSVELAFHVDLSGDRDNANNDLNAGKVIKALVFSPTNTSYPGLTMITPPANPLLARLPF